ncbi:F0F1 ATP synthase subunit B family protein [Marinobacter arenosus]|uniref:F0F1 ATP synthase subunit B family protein n=1 Tax=Marinobacter arenosus TaxID=2856822 RepID=UPI001C4A7FE8|nr:F0F1 ATP synthase subunit B [Marinobacter arenosus]MBW0148390.1 F0F1 ATP synthase subunit B [Marinobacter arenosus]
MSLDWITVIAQILNFLVLVWLLKRFLYRPILDGIDAREAEIAARMSEADRAKARAVAAEAEFVARKEKLLEEDAAVVEAARVEAERQRDALLAAGRETLRQEEQEWRAHLAHEQNQFVTELYRASADTLYELVGKALHDLADADLEERMALHVIGRLRTLAEELETAAGNAAEATVTSHQLLSDTTRDLLTREVQALVPDVPLRFVADPLQSPGLVLRLGSAQLVWTVDRYTQNLAEQLAERMATGASRPEVDHGP